MNLFSGKIVRKAGGLAFSGKVIEFFLPSALGKAVWRSRVSFDEDVSVGVKLADTLLVGTATGQILLQGEVVDLETKEAGMLVTARVGDERVRLMTESQQALRFGQIISIAFSLSSVFLVRHLTGELIRSLSG